MSLELFDLVALKSGHNSLRLKENNETFHPVIGPDAEAKILHVEQQRIAERSQELDEFIIWDVGLGAAANALACLQVLPAPRARVELHSFDKTLDPLQFALHYAEALPYLLPYRNLLARILSTGWVQVNEQVRWYFHLGDFREQLTRPDLPAPHAILYDPYSVRGNHEMWSLEHFARLRQRLADEKSCLLSNYSRSTAIRCTLLLAGFYVGRGTSIGEKEESTLASNQLAQLERPLDANWLHKVADSQNANIVRVGGYRYGFIQEDDLRLLREHPQFSG